MLIWLHYIAKAHTVLQVLKKKIMLITFLSKPSLRITLKWFFLYQPHLKKKKKKVKIHNFITTMLNLHSTCKLWVCEKPWFCNVSGSETSKVGDIPTPLSTPLTILCWAILPASFTPGFTGAPSSPQITHSLPPQMLHSVLRRSQKHTLQSSSVLHESGILGWWRCICLHIHNALQSLLNLLLTWFYSVN